MLTWLTGAVTNSIIMAHLFAKNVRKILEERNEQS